MQEKRNDSQNIELRYQNVQNFRNYEINISDCNFIIICEVSYKSHHDLIKRHRIEVSLYISIS